MNSNEQQGETSVDCSKVTVNNGWSLAVIPGGIGICKKKYKFSFHTCKGYPLVHAGKQDKYKHPLFEMVDFNRLQYQAPNKYFCLAKLWDICFSVWTVLLVSETPQEINRCINQCGIAIGEMGFWFIFPVKIYTSNIGLQTWCERKHRRLVSA